MLSTRHLRSLTCAEVEMSLGAKAYKKRFWGVIDLRLKGIKFSTCLSSVMGGEDEGWDGSMWALRVAMRAPICS